MKSPAPTSGTGEYVLTDSDLIISKTDPQGKLTYANRDFMRICGYTERQLLGQPHNLIRHPDMPRGAFRLMWKELQQGREFFALVKNATASGSYYWVFANITPDYSNDGKLKGYYSVRRRPARAALAAITPIYARMRDIEQRSGKAEAPDASLAWLQQELGERSYESFILELNAEVFEREPA